ncbi:MAG: AAA family ATPase [Deltaproteobacteria bacterium]|nr:AAA family ATPase [Deltaproteobacteria bacterium]
MIKTLKVKNYKSLRDVKINFGYKNLLIGPNMSGKSNIIDCLIFISESAVGSGAGSSLFNSITKRGGFEFIAWDRTVGKEVIFYIEGDFYSDSEKKAFDFTYEIAIVIQSNAFHKTKEEFKIRTKQKKSKEKNILDNWTSVIDINLSRSVIYNYPDIATPREISRDFNLAVSIDYGIGVINDFKKYLISFYIYNINPSEIKKSVNATVPPPFLMANGTNISSWFLDIKTSFSDNFDEIEKIVKDYLPNLKSLFVPLLQSGGVSLSSKEEGLKNPITISQMSDGEVHFLAIISLLFSPIEKRGFLYAIEEPENYLHTRLIKAIPNLLDQRIKFLKYNLPVKEKMPQFIFTSHSIEFMNEFDINDIIFVEKKNAETIVSKPGDKEYIKKILEEEELMPSDILVYNYSAEK